MMDFLDPVDIEPRYPGRRQSKLLSKVIRSSQYEPQIPAPPTRYSIYKQNSGDSKSQSRKSRYHTNTELEFLEKSSPPKESSFQHSPPQSSQSRKSRHITQACQDQYATSTGSPNSHRRASTHEKQSSRRSRYQTSVTPESSTISAPIAIQNSPPSESSRRRSRHSPQSSPDPPSSFLSQKSLTPSNCNSILEQEQFNNTEETDIPDDLFCETLSIDHTPPNSGTAQSPSTPAPLMEVGDYLVKRDIGQGTFGIVKLAEHKITKMMVAIKVIAKSSIKNARARARVEQELRLLPLLDHPHIVKVYDVIEDEERFMIVMEHISGGELFQYIVKNRRVNEREARYFFRQILSALDYCHQNSIVHRDLKPENLLLDSKMQIKLIDFGFANFYHPNSTLGTYCGSPYYASPEMIRGIDYVGPEVDIWSLGVTLYTMLSGKLPFNAFNLKSFQRKVTRGEYEIPVYFSKEVTEVIKCMLNTDRRKRISLEKIRLHSWTNAGYSDLPNSFLTIRPSVIRNPDNETMKLMEPYGYDYELVKTSLITNNRSIDPVFCLYHLLEESKVRKEKQNKKIEKQRQRSLKKVPLPPPIDTSLQALEPKDLENELSPTSPDEVCQVSVKSRRYSIDTTRDEDFSNDLPLSKTPLKAAGRSFDSISRRCSIQSKLRPVHTSNLTTGEVELGGTQRVIDKRLLLEKEPKDGWFTGLFNVSTTSNKPYQQIVQELERVLNNLQIEFQEFESRFVCESKSNKLTFEVRIVWKDSVKAFLVHFKNLKGSSWAHKKHCYKIIQRMFI